MHLDWWTLGLQTLNFGVLVWLLHRFLYRPVQQLVAARKAEIQRQYADAKAAEENASTQVAAVEAERAGISAEREATLKAARAQGEKMAAERRAQSERDAQNLLDSTRKTLAAERQQALADAQRLALGLGAQFAQQLLTSVPMSLRGEAWIGRIEQYLKDLAPSERDALARQLAAGEALTVVTAAPLPAAAAENWHDRLRALLGNSIIVAFEVKPELVAGAELRFPTALLQFSWESALASMRSEVSSHADAH
ncbi:MAG: ATP synthase F0 subunit B [Proteobacteria bacterium]|nr:ATP synthase F0 subunit B [Pseudomonadota bacterium]